MNQHYAPEVYLKQWCGDDGRLVRYWRVGHEDAPRLRWDRKAPKGICWEEDLYSLPPGAVANGLTDYGVEGLLAETVDAAIPSILRDVAGRSGLLESSTAARLRWLMQSFAARTPRGLAAVETGVADWILEEGPAIARVKAEARTPETRDEMQGYLAPQMPAVAARAGLSAIAGNQGSPIGGWLEGAVFLTQAAQVERVLSALGLDHFPTFDQPVIQWEENEAGLVASFAVGPTTLALVLADGAQLRWELILRHLLLPMRYRQLAICQHEIMAGRWLSAADALVPWAR